MNALRSRVSDIARLISGLSKGGLSRLTRRFRGVLDVTISQIACGAWFFTSLTCGIVTPLIRAADEGERTRRQVLDDRILDAVEIGSPWLPVIRIAGHRNRLVRLEIDEFERAGADRVLPHLARRDVARINR